MSETPKTDHAYDGIEEYDNPLPGWWKWLFIASIVFCPFYWVFYHSGTKGRSLEDSYNVALAENTRLQFEEIGELKLDGPTIARFMGKDSWVKVGEAVFRANCVSCHGREGEGKVGPNLTDDFYKNVAEIGDIGLVIANGAGNGAMPKWSNRLHINEMVLVSAYVAKMRGNNVDGRPTEGRQIAPWPDVPADDAETTEGGEGEEADAEGPA
ncbi:cbb3-type cytochrome c oxidase N-terminal domain-containing protein [Roseiconus lacunae]|uniref:Cbb3-type cytochrome c oxidase N-terminal domain-containing protein n=1 Tax=Roseiconus lacunae TaxID=2605694 RepID=A0ABT7PBU3_9BACT|nr:cbb3-type cytochrome c oxidase N-terminal domain-containing protein [Roseiconus lacunae]MDM4013963.1 cbb3-type cytochrome c oxidase N-terminal domain-containing protein [Roseiconus lacunae]